MVHMKQGWVSKLSKNKCLIGYEISFLNIKNKYPTNVSMIKTILLGNSVHFFRLDILSGHGVFIWHLGMWHVISLPELLIFQEKIDIRTVFQLNEEAPFNNGMPLSEMYGWIKICWLLFLEVSVPKNCCFIMKYLKSHKQLHFLSHNSSGNLWNPIILQLQKQYFLNVSDIIMVAVIGHPYDLDGNLCHKATSWSGTSITNIMVDTWALFTNMV